MAKLCECGCGQPAPIAKQTVTKKGWRKGEPKRFISGHNSRPRSRREHPRWKGGRIVTAQGYVSLHRPGHPRANPKGYVPEHIVIAEGALRRPLPPAAVIHHVNERRNDNRNGNLVVCENQAYHALLHQRARALAECGNANWRRCVYCKRYDAPENMARHSGTSMCHPECNNRYRRERRAAKRGC